MPLRSDYARTGERREVRRHCILRYVELACDLTRRQSAWFMSNKQAKGLKSRFLRERCQRGDGGDLIHISTLMDMSGSRNARRPVDVRFPDLSLQSGLSAIGQTRAFNLRLGA